MQGETGDENAGGDLLELGTGRCCGEREIGAANFGGSSARREGGAVGSGGEIDGGFFSAPEDACTVSARVAECDKEPLPPWAVIVKLPVGAFVAAPKTMATFAPDAMLNGLAGLVATPVGRPAKVT
jgi:hypothetical protein